MSLCFEWGGRIPRKRIFAFWKEEKTINASAWKFENSLFVGGCRPISEKYNSSDFANWTADATTILRFLVCVIC